MGTIMDVAAEQLVRLWLSDTTGGEVLAPAISGKIQSGLKKLHELGTTNDPQDSDNWCRRIFAIPSSLQDQDLAGGYVARLVLGWLPNNLHSFGSALSYASDPNRAKVSLGLADPIGPVTNTSPERWIQLFRSRLGLDTHELEQALTSPGWLRSPGPRNPENLAKLLRNLLESFKKKSTPAYKQFASDVAREIRDLPLRLMAAGALEGWDIAMPSSRPIGNQVQEELRARYLDRASKRLTYKIVAERRVYTGVSYPKGRHWHGIDAEGKIFDTAYKELLGGDLTLVALCMARLSPRSLTGTLRDDLVDLGLAENWEIKPIGSAIAGVLQEVEYRMLFNFWATVFTEMGVPININHLDAGRDWDVIFPGILAPVDLGHSWAHPFCTDLLPGLVLYYVLKKDLNEEMAVIAAALTTALLDLLSRAAKEVRKLQEQFARLMEVIAQVVQVVVMFVVAVMAAVIVVCVAFKLVPAAAAGLGLAASATLAGAGLLILVFPKGSRDGSSKDGDRQTRQDKWESAYTTLSFGSCRLVDFPMAKFPLLLKSVDEFFAQSLDAVFPEIDKPPAV